MINNLCCSVASLLYFLQNNPTHVPDFVTSRSCEFNRSVRTGRPIVGDRDEGNAHAEGWVAQLFIGQPMLKGIYEGRHMSR